jgi:tripartite-type tricarboxylate transporter receptor subunit TctC
MKLARRHLLYLAAGAAALPAMSRTAWPFDYPLRPVRIVAGYPPGVGPEAIARLVSQSCRSGSIKNSSSRTGRGPAPISPPNLW